MPMNAARYALVSISLFFVAFNVGAVEPLGRLSTADDAVSGPNTHDIRSAGVSPGAMGLTLDQTLELIDKELFAGNPRNEFPDDLRRALETVLQSHPDWKRSAAELRKAIANLEKSRSITRFQLTANADLTYRENTDNQLTGAQGSSNTTAGAQVRARKLLTDFGATDARIRAAESGVEESGFKIEVDRSELLNTVLSGLIARQQSLLQSLWHSSVLVARQEILAVARERLELGAGTIYEISRAQSSYANALLEKERIDSSIESIEEALKRIGIDGSVLLPLKIIIPPPDIKRLNQPASLALVPVLGEIDQKISRLKQELEAATKDSRPRIYFDSLIASRKPYDPNASQFIEGTVQINLEYAILDGGLKTSNVAFLSSELNQALAERDSRLLALRDEVTSISSQYGAINRSISLLREAIKYAQDGYYAAKERFAYRRGSIEEIQRSEDELKQRVSELLTSYFDRYRLNLSLHNRLGSLRQLFSPPAVVNY